MEALRQSWLAQESSGSMTLVGVQSSGWVDAGGRFVDFGNCLPPAFTRQSSGAGQYTATINWRLAATILRPGSSQ